MVDLFSFQLDFENFLQFIFSLWTLNFFMVDLFSFQLDFENFLQFIFSLWILDLNIDLKLICKLGFHKY